MLCATCNYKGWAYTSQKWNSVNMGWHFDCEQIPTKPDIELQKNYHFGTIGHIYGFGYGPVYTSNLEKQNIQYIFLQRASTFSNISCICYIFYLLRFQFLYFQRAKIDKN